MFEKLFHLRERGTNIRTELIAGMTTFTTMAYILAVNPGILSASGMEFSKMTISGSSEKSGEESMKVLS